MRFKSTTSVCGWCGKTYHPTLGSGGKFCSRRCAYDSRIIPAEERFWAKIRKGDGCWLWFADKQRRRFAYGGLSVDGKYTSAHRYSYQLHFGPIPDDAFICHRCDNPGCVRPDHLFLGTAADNTADMVQKGRHAHGDGHVTSKLCEDDVRVIRARYEAGETTMKALAAEYGVHRSSIGLIIHRRCWKHVS